MLIKIKQNIQRMRKILLEKKLIFVASFWFLKILSLQKSALKNLKTLANETQNLVFSFYFLTVFQLISPHFNLRFKNIRKILNT